jgi:hypothetical protein
MKNWKYVKVFPNANACVPKRPELFELFGALCELPQLKGNSLLPAGYTYFGQFIDHDVSLLVDNAEIPNPRRPNGTVPAHLLTLGRKPTLDLDSMYGAGLDDSIVPFDEEGRFLLGNTGFGDNRDFKRDPLFRPLIADRRNDENLLVAQMQILFMRLHNKIIDTGPPMSLDARFARAQKAVVNIYQYLVLHDFLPRLVSDAVYEAIIVNNGGVLNDSQPQSPTMALEASQAAFRLHALVRPFYALNSTRDASLAEIVDVAGAARRFGDFSHPLLKAADEVDWRLFFPFKGYTTQRAKQIVPVMSPDLLGLTDDAGQRANMLELNILRGIVRGLCSGQDAIQALKKIDPDVARQLSLDNAVEQNNALLSSLSTGSSIRTATPLWLYITLEAGGRARLGDLGGWLLADTLRAAALNAEMPSELLKAEESVKGLHGDLLAVAANPLAVSVADVVTYVYH